MTKPTAEELNVSRETFERLGIFVKLLEKWTSKINLISNSTVPSIWSRHICDSLQVYQAGPGEFDHWLDLGSGGGLPGLVVAIMAESKPTQKMVTLIESDGRKAAFLRTVLRETGVTGCVLCDRIESITPQNVDVISARALTELPHLIYFASHHLNDQGVGLFPKGVTWEEEVKAARQTWSFNLEVLESTLEEGSVILKIGDISRV